MSPHSPQGNPNAPQDSQVNSEAQIIRRLNEVRSSILSHLRSSSPSLPFRFILRALLFCLVHFCFTESQTQRIDVKEAMARLLDVLIIGDPDLSPILLQMWNQPNAMQEVTSQSQLSQLLLDISQSASKVQRYLFPELTNDSRYVIHGPPQSSQSRISNRSTISSSGVLLSGSSATQASASSTHSFASQPLGPSQPLGLQGLRPARGPFPQSGSFVEVGAEGEAQDLFLTSLELSHWLEEVFDDPAPPPPSSIPLPPPPPTNSEEAGRGSFEFGRIQ